MYLVLFLSLFFVPAFSKIDNSEKLLKEIKSRISDPKAALRFVYSSKDWGLLIHEIEIGNKDFLRFWFLLRSHSDGGATEELNGALSNLLKTNAELVLTSIDSASKDKNIISKYINEVCSVSGLEVQDKKFASSKDEKKAVLDGLALRLKSLSKITSNKVGNFKKICEFEIHKNIKYWNSK